MQIAYISQCAASASKRPKLSDLLIEDKKKSDVVSDDAAALASALIGFGATLPTLKTEEEPSAE